MYRKRILAYTEIIDYKIYINCKYRFRVISGSHILHLPVKSVIVGIKVHYIFDISFKSFHCLFLLFFTGRGTCTGAFEKPAPLYQGGKYFLCGRRHLSQHAVCTSTVPDRWEFWLCSCGCRDAHPEQERVHPVTSGTSGWMEGRKSPGNEGTGWHHSWFWMERGQDTQGSPLFFPWAESNAGM